MGGKVNNAEAGRKFANGGDADADAIRRRLGIDAQGRQIRPSGSPPMDAAPAMPTLPYNPTPPPGGYPKLMEADGTIGSATDLATQIANRPTMYTYEQARGRAAQRDVKSPWEQKLIDDALRKQAEQERIDAYNKELTDAKKDLVDDFDDQF